MINLSKDQLQDTIHSLLNKDQGLNEQMEIILNGLMELERDTFLSTQASPANKGNGYRPGSANGYGKKLSPRIPRDRLGNFQLVVWALLRDQNEQVRRLCFELYGKGLTTRQIGEITQKIYGSHYSSSAVSIFNQKLADQLTQWRQRPLQKRYPRLLHCYDPGEGTPRAWLLGGLLYDLETNRRFPTRGSGSGQHPLGVDVWVERPVGRTQRTGT